MCERFPAALSGQHDGQLNGCTCLHHLPPPALPASPPFPQLFLRTPSPPRSPLPLPAAALACMLSPLGNDAW
eukprot:177148-Chlamydomonas_euryale.AAC.1